MTDAGKSTLCGVIYPEDPTKEHCKCIVSLIHLGRHRCDCNFHWETEPEREPREKFEAEMRAIREAERRAFLVQRDIFGGPKWRR